jgi:methyl-accepting chemotaxis protein
MSKTSFLKRLTIRHRILVLAAAAVLTSAINSGVGLVASSYTDRIMAWQDQLNTMIGNHKDIDTMHDSLRAYVLLKLRQQGVGSTAPAVSGDASAAQLGDGMDMGQIQSEYRDHRDELLAALDENRKLAAAMDFTEVSQVLDELAPMLQGSATASAEIVMGPADGGASTNEKVSEFLRTFKQPEAKMDGLAEMLDNRLKQSREDSAQVIEMTRWALIGVCLFGALLVLALAIGTFKSVIRPLLAMTGAMGSLAGGDRNIAVPALDRHDEIGGMAKTVEVFKANLIERDRLEREALAAEGRERRESEERAKIEQAAAEEIAQLVKRAAAGDFSKRIDLDSKSGFFHALAGSVNQLVGTIGTAMGQLIVMMAAMANGDLSKRMSGNYQGELLRLKDDANATAVKLAEIVGQTVEGMASIKASTTEIATGAADLSSRTEKQVASLEEIAASIRQLNSTVQQSAENAGQASQLAKAARTSAEGGGAVAGAAVKAMGEIEQSSQRISDIVGVIDEIAFQTNLLALNAAVEAARAGEAGRGFAVVAGEVRALAQRSSHASKEIKALITSSDSQVKQGVELVNKAGATLGEIVTSITRVSDIVAEIAAANKEQSASVGEVQEAIGHIEQATQQNAALVEETTAALGSTDNQVQNVTDVISFFQCDDVEVAEPANAPAPARAGVRRPPAKRPAATGTNDD